MPYQTLKTIDWNKYRENFPKKYWECGYFDMMVEKFTKNFNWEQAKILDVGAGAVSQECFAKFKNYYCLDPFIDKQNNAKNIFNWDNFEQQFYHFYLCRGAINYLTPEQMKKLVNHMSPCNMFVFNTFANLPVDRDFSTCKKTAFINQKGQTCLESAIAKEGNYPCGWAVEHLIEGPDFKIEHDFYYYSQEFFQDMFPNIKIMTQPTKPSSLICLFTKI